MKTILTVDDSTTICRLLEKILRAGGYDTRSARTGEAALAIVDEIVPDAIISDLHMPGMDGIELVAALRARPGLETTPILLMTTESHSSRREEARAAGASGWLVKPVRSRVLLDTLSRVIDG